MKKLPSEVSSTGNVLFGHWMGAFIIFNLDVARVSMAVLVLGAKTDPFHSTVLQSSSTQEC